MPSPGRLTTLYAPNIQRRRQATSTRGTSARTRWYHVVTLSLPIISCVIRWIIYLSSTRGIPLKIACTPNVLISVFVRLLKPPSSLIFHESLRLHVSIGKIPCFPSWRNIADFETMCRKLISLSSCWTSS